VADDAVWGPEALAADLTAAAGAGARLLLVGDGALRYAPVLAAVPGARWAGPAYGAPPVAALAELCVRRAAAGELADAAGVLPRYLRQADARINWEQRLAPRTPTPAGG
jgi:hypothetical protein